MRVFDDATSTSELLADAHQVSPALGEAFATWRRQKTAAALPVWSAVHFSFYPAPLIPWAAVGVYDAEHDDFRLRFWGSSRTDVFKLDPSGAFVPNLRDVGLGAELRAEYGEVRERRAPLIFRFRIESEQHAAVPYYKIRLPLRHPGRDSADVVLTLIDPTLLTRQMYIAWNVEPPLNVR